MVIHAKKEKEKKRTVRLARFFDDSEGAVGADWGGITHWAKRTAGVKLCPRRRASGIRSYQLRYSW